jgi:hypothetical protein
MCRMSNSQVDTDEARLKRWVAKREGETEVPERIWQEIVEDRLVGDWRAEDPELRDKVRDQILKRYRRYKRLVRDVGGEVVAASQDGQEGDSTLLRATLPAGDPMALRAEALCLYWAKLAEAEQQVRQFRKDLLDGGVASESEARNLMHSPVAGRLNDLATDLCSRYPWQSEDAAWFVLTGEAPWVPPLTAHINRLPSPRNQGTITITAAYWAPKAAVSEFYAEVKAEVRARIMDIAPTPSPRRLALFRFIVERSQGIDQWGSLKPEGPRSVHVQGLPVLHVQGLHVPQWRSLQAQWNEEYPEGHEWHYSDHRNLRRDFKEAFEALAGHRS